MALRSNLVFRVLLCSAALFLAAASMRAVLAQESLDDSDLRKQLALGKGLLGKTPDPAAIQYFIAGTHALLHEPFEAIAGLKECVLAKEGFDPSHDPLFVGLKYSTEFQHLTELVHKDFPEVNHAQQAFVIPEKDLIPEGLAYDPSLDVFYLGSLHLKKILRIPREAPARISDFVAADRYHLLPILGVRMDPSDGSIWSASWLENGPTELLHFDKSGTLLGRYSPDEDKKHGFNDLIVLRDGAIYVTDTLDNRVYRFDPKPKTFHILKFNRDLYQPNGITISGDERALYVADQFGVLRYDIASGRSAEVSPGVSNTLAGADGLYWHNGWLVAIQNGIGSPRIAAFELSSDGLHITKTEILENRSPYTALPTTGAIRGNQFYFIVNSQIDNLNGDRILDVTTLAPVRIGVLELP